MAPGVDYASVSKLSLRLRAAQLLAPKRMQNYLDAVGDDLAEEMAQRAPVRSGNLRDHIRKYSESGLVRVGIYGVPYTEYVVKGTQPHLIRPKNAQALRFRVGGTVVYAKLVHHPGTKPNPFMTDAVKAVLHSRHGRASGLKFLGPSDVSQ